METVEEAREEGRWAVGEKAVVVGSAAVMGLENMEAVVREAGKGAKGTVAAAEAEVGRVPATRAAVVKAAGQVVVTEVVAWVAVARAVVVRAVVLETAAMGAVEMAAAEMEAATAEGVTAEVVLWVEETVAEAWAVAMVEAATAEATVAATLAAQEVLRVAEAAMTAVRAEQVVRYRRALAHRPCRPSAFPFWIAYRGG